MKALRIAALLAVLAGAAAMLWRPVPPPATESASPPGGTADPAISAVDTGPGVSAERAQAAEITPTVEAGRAASPAAAAHGRIRDTFGAPLAGIEIVAETRTANGLLLAASRTRSDRDGEFRFDDLLAGREYRLDIEPQQHHGGYRLDSFVAGRAELPQEILLQPLELVDVDGLVVDAERLPVADFEFAVRSLATEFPERVLQSDSSGYFSLREFPAGEIGIATSGADYFHIQGIVLRADAYRTLTLVIDRGSHYLGGWVGDANGVPVAGAQVTLKSALAVDGYQSFSYRATVADENGGFAFPRLGGSRATLGVLANGFEVYTRRHEFASFSDTISVTLQRLPP